MKSTRVFTWKPFGCRGRKPQAQANLVFHYAYGKMNTRRLLSGALACCFLPTEGIFTPFIDQGERISFTHL